MPSDMKNNTVVAFESRRADDMRQMIAHHNGVAMVTPSIKEVPLDSHEAVFVFAEKLLAGEVDVLVCMTGVGIKMLANVWEARYEKAALVDTLRSITVVVRGPKPVAALRELKIAVDITAPEPNTWQGVLATLRQHDQINDKRIAIQEYGETNIEFHEALTAEGASVLPVPIYRWTRPDDLQPMREAIRFVTEKRAAACLFTAAVQVRHVIATAREDGMLDEFVTGYQQLISGSIGSVTSAAMRKNELHVDFEAQTPHMGQLVNDLAEKMSR